MLLITTILFVQTIDYTSPRGGISVVNSEQLADGVTTEIDSITVASVGDGYASASSGPTDIPGYTSTLLIHKVIGNTYIITHLLYNYGIW